MELYKTSDIKNIAILGSPKSGKTSLAETMMFEGGVIGRRGTVEAHNTISDYHEIEHERENSVFTTILHTEWRGQKINILDTPGYDDFIGEIISSLRVADTGMMVLNSAYGVEVATELFWNYVEDFNKPMILAVNQVDHEKSDFDSTVFQIKDRLDKKAILVQYPLNEGEGFNSIIDLLKMVMYKFPKDGGKPEKLPIPEEEKEKADRLHNELVEAAAENDDKLMELYFEKGELDEDEMRKGIKMGMLHRDLFPIFCVAALKNMGSGRIMGFIDNVCPSASEMPPQETTTGGEIECTNQGKTNLFIFKTAIEPHIGEMTYFKVASGEVKVSDDLINLNNQSKERLNQLFVMDGKNRNQVTKLVAGDIGATVKLKNTHTNDTLSNNPNGDAIQPIKFPAPRMNVAIRPVKEGEEEKMAEALHDLHEQDPTITVEHSAELKQTIIYCQGELHLAVIKWHLENVYKLNVDFVEPRIPYRETIEGKSEASYRHKKQSGGAGQFGEVYLHIEPYYEGIPKPSQYNVRNTEEIQLPWGGKLQFHNCIVGGAIDARYIPSILKGIMEKMENGPLTGSYVRDVSVAVYDGKMHPVDSNDISFKIAGASAFSKAFRESRPKIMEPVYEVEISVPEEFMGEVMTDLQTRRAMIMGMDNVGSLQKIRAKVPLAELYKYSTKLRSLTHGRASHTRKFSEYQAVPMEIQERLIHENEEAVAV